MGIDGSGIENARVAMSEMGPRKQQQLERSRQQPLVSEIHRQGAPNAPQAWKPIQSKMQLRKIKRPRWFPEIGVVSAAIQDNGIFVGIARDRGYACSERRIGARFRRGRRVALKETTYGVGLQVQMIGFMPEPQAHAEAAGQGGFIQVIVLGVSGTKSVVATRLLDSERKRRRIKAGAEHQQWLRALGAGPARRVG